jgi:hypothetical protein
LGISQQLSNNLPILPRGYPTTIGHFPSAFLFTLLAVLSGCSIALKIISPRVIAKLSNFCPISSQQRFQILNIMNQRHTGKFSKPPVAPPLSQICITT